ncbi:PEP-CTERM sorting domain-containing protein [Mariniblastus fucicola]|uniref:Ice-binding protein C-terminal domain-containing protein n=1 Tax=Mariniblastus fucicola TaxID=980251 RepID=A0A5B9PBF5_9BACT|nr:PEP-CTERM sorting domain-containing protein [Mariniblastus fucicola]QEG20461.1 hypothetical protein MFFC18_03090 [Mariniblastus fucicola]
MKKFILVLTTAIAVSFSGGFAIADIAIGGANYDDAETGITSGTPDLANESTGNSSTVMGMFTDQTGAAHNYLAEATVFSGITSYGVTNGGPNNSDENRVEYQASSDRFTFGSGWDSGDGSTGEYVEQCLTVTFDRVSDAADFSVTVSSANTAGEAFESTAVQFIDAGGNLVGNLSYLGFWDTVSSTVNSDVIMNSADVWTAESTSVIDVTTDSDNPFGTSDGANNDATIFASDYISGGVTGYKITRWLEDVATVGGVAGTGTTTTTNFTTSNGAATVSVAAVPEPGAASLIALGLVGFVVRRRRS